MIVVSGTSLISAATYSIFGRIYCCPEWFDVDLPCWDLHKVASWLSSEILQAQTSGSSR